MVYNETKKGQLAFYNVFKIVNDLVDVTTDGILDQQIDNLRGHTRKFRQLTTTVDSYYILFSWQPSKRGIS